MDDFSEKVIAPKKEVAGKPWVFPSTTLSEAYALQALEKGEATSEQQIKALKWIVEKLCGTYDLSYRPDSSRDTDFALGKQFVGLQIVRFIKTNLATYKEKSK